VFAGAAIVNPFSINPLALIVGATVAIGIGFGGGWTVNGWRLQGDIEHIKTERATDSVRQSQAALDDLVTAAGKIKAAADGANVDLSHLDSKLDQIRKDYKNAKPAPLPVDCRPDAPRVRKLTAAADAVDEAIAGLKLSRVLQADRAP
jgi:hypothetical protein